MSLKDAGAFNQTTTFTDFVGEDVWSMDITGTSIINKEVTAESMWYITYVDYTTMIIVPSTERWRYHSDMLTTEFERVRTKWKMKLVTLGGPAPKSRLPAEGDLVGSSAGVGKDA